MKENKIKNEIELEENLEKINEMCLGRDEKNLIKLSIENVWKVNAMIRENSRYTTDLGNSRVSPDEKFVNNYLKKFIKNEIDEKAQKKDCGSVSWWVEQLKDTKINDEQYKIIIAGLIHDIDRMNSTHLNADKAGNKNGRFLMFDRIIRNYDNKTKLIDALKDENKMPLIELISKQDANGKINFSFATKFCHYLSWNYFNDANSKDMYSIYDGIVADSLQKYLNEYKENEKIKKYFEETKNRLEKIDNKLMKKYFYEENNAVKEKFFTSFFSTPFFKKKYIEEDTIVTFYKIYIDAIDNIREILAEGENLISRNAFDHLLWYGNKKNRNTNSNKITLEEILS